MGIFKTKNNINILKSNNSIFLCFNKFYRNKNGKHFIKIFLTLLIFKRKNLKSDFLIFLNFYQYFRHEKAKFYLTNQNQTLISFKICQIKLWILKKKINHKKQTLIFQSFNKIFRNEKAKYSLKNHTLIILIFSNKTLIPQNYTILFEKATLFDTSFDPKVGQTDVHELMLYGIHCFPFVTTDGTVFFCVCSIRW